MMYTRDMIKNKFTEVICEYLNKGYNIEVLDACWRNSSMIDLTKKELNRNNNNADNSDSFADYVRVSFNSKRLYDGNYDDYRVTYSIEVSRYNNYRDFDIFKTYKFIQLSNNKDIYMDADDYDNIMQIRQRRLQNKFNDKFVIDRCIDLNNISVSMRNKIMDRIHNFRGMKSAKFDVVKLIHFHRDDNRLICEVYWHDGCEKHGILRIE